jgi:outer membrane protein OmpA-like peptidoglycan-associated protein
VEIEGHTDSTGSDELNQKLSTERAAAVQTYLLNQGVAETAVSARGLGKDSPIASNDTAAGRRQNRRVEIVVSGETLGSPLGSL